MFGYEEELQDEIRELKAENEKLKLRLSDVISSINEDKDTNSLIKKLRQDLDKIRKEYEGKLTRNTIRDEFEEQIGKI
jgi:predicted RNase H-like nuclease (RuvC/YqgF family)